MSRKGPQRKQLPVGDPVYDSSIVQRFINQMMQDGKKSKSEMIFYTAMTLIEDKSGRNPLEIFSLAIKNIAPAVEVRSRRVGGQSYQVPSEVRPERKAALAVRWTLQNTRKRSEKTMAEKLANELLDAARGSGGSVKKKEDTHRMAESNKMFAHYRW
ncbi:MAG TPA: 30S ribosomal protein S7 [Abditibacteriaceae bacterium]|jgi:small subunit ribosomal protein S7